VVRMSVAEREWVLIHRARLLEVLAEAANGAGVQIETGTEVVSVADGRAPRVDLADGTCREASLLVGTDGIRGCTRAALGPGQAPRFTGQAAWRAVVPGEGSPVVEVHMAPGRHIVTYPLAGGIRNLVAVEARRAWTEEGWSTKGDPAEMRHRFTGVSPQVMRMLDAVHEVHVWGLHRHPVASRWHGQRVVLAGDSVHPTLPFLAQGANMALEDAWALADCVERLPLERALPAYQARRQARVSRIVAASGRNAWVYHMWRGPQRWALHTGLRLAERVRPGGAISRFDWVYGHDETAVASL
jgi:salicylate hydroxylase